ncbi:hypothetical protein Clacol_000177 [Clathrus columnatus]|uniref:C2H2-type domain-containing protein n=1 Tax=Clathrus columnatus TaxID=1419009 RepID=A0AAV4ZZ61_9AGAM|nr:hypothetical protein Clacol_000177 [Clathrus columnatus]
MPHLCIPCNRKFNSPKALDAHKRDSSNHHICIACDADFATDQSLKQHYVDSVDHVSCKTCLRVFLTNEALIEHYKNSWQHHYCSFCDRHFKTAAALKKHSNSLYAHRFCSRCDKGFADAEDLRRHNREEHYVCTACEQAFGTEDKQIKHAVNHHPYCVDCERAFRTEHDLFQHYSSKHELTEIVCQGHGCAKPFKSYGALTQHFDSGACPSGLNSDHLSKLVVNSYRNKTITGLKTLIKTSISNTVRTTPAQHVRNGRKYACPLCHKTFISYQKFCAHLRSQGHETRLFRCPNQGASCGVEFGTFSALTQHLESGKCGLNRFVLVKDLLALLNRVVGMVKI